MSDHTLSTAHLGRGGTRTATTRRSGLAWWPMDRRGAALLVAAWVVGVATWTAVGLLLVHVLDHTAIARADLRVSQWFEAHRTTTWTDLSGPASMASDTITKLIAIPLLALLFVAVWRRWHDALFLVAAMLLEVCVFVTTTYLVDRDRPPVERLDGSLPTHSYPSGHVAAAVTFYLGLALIVGWHTRSRWLRGAAAVVAVVVPSMVAISRLYRGMHYLTDVLAGALLGAAVLITMLHVMRATVARMPASHPEGPPPPEVRALDLTTDTIDTTDLTSTSRGTPS